MDDFLPKSSLDDVQKDIANQLQQSFSHLTEAERQEMCRDGLVEEVGEVFGIFKGRIRKYSKDNARCTTLDLKSELGDVLWYLTALCVLHGTSLDEIYQLNCKKLDGRNWR